MRTLRILLLICVGSLAVPILVAKSPNHSIGAKTGMINYSTQGFRPKSGSNVQNFTFEWNYFIYNNFAAISGYRSASDTVSSRTLFQEAFGGTRYFPMTLGVPLKSKVGTSTLAYDFFLKPYIDTGMSFGRYLIATSGNPAILEYSSDYYGLFFGFGTYIGLTEDFFLDFGLTYANLSGFNSPLAFAGTNIMILLGVSTYL